MSFFFGEDIRLSTYLAINDNNLDFLEKNKSRIVDADIIKKEDWTIYSIYNGNVDLINFFYSVLGYLPEKDDDDKYVLCQIAYSVGKDSLKFENTFRYLLKIYNNNIPDELYENISLGYYDPIISEIVGVTTPIR